MKLLRVLALSIVDAALTIIVLISIVLAKLPMVGIYVAYGVSAVVLPLLTIIIYRKIWGSEKLVLLPISYTIASLYSLGIAIYSRYGIGSFPSMFHELMYFIYFLPSIIYCGVSWIIYAIFVRFQSKH